MPRGSSCLNLRAFRDCAAQKRLPEPARIQSSCRAEGASRFQMSIQQTSRLSGLEGRLVCTQSPRRAEAFSRHRASVDHPARRRSDSEGGAYASGDRAARRALFRFQMSIQQTSRLSGLEGRLVCVPVICCCTCATGWPYRSSRRCRRTCRCPCGWT